MTNRTLPPPTSSSALERPGANARPWTRQARRDRLDGLLAERILVLDGAMGTMLQALRVHRGGLPRRSVPRPPPRPARRQRPAVPDPAGRRRAPSTPRTSAPAPTSLDHELVHGDADRPGRLRLRPRDRPRHQRRGGPAGARGRRRRRAADPARPRFVAGSLGPTNRTASMSSGRRRPGRPQRHLGGARGRLSRVGRRPDRRRRRHPADRDDLRHAQRQGGDLRGPVAVRRDRRAAAADHLRDDRRCLRPNPVRPDRRGVLAQHPPRRPAHRRAQLRARAEAAPRAPRRAGAGRRPADLGLPERRPAQRARRLRRDARADGRGARRVGAARPAEHRRLLLRLDARPHRARSPPRSPASRRARSRSAPRTTRLVRPRAGGHPAARQRLRQRRRADERHRLAQVRPAHRRRAARTRRSISPASRSPTAPSSST